MKKFNYFVKINGCGYPEEIGSLAKVEQFIKEEKKEWRKSPLNKYLKPHFEVLKLNIIK